MLQKNLIAPITASYNSGNDCSLQHHGLQYRRFGLKARTKYGLLLVSTIVISGVLIGGMMGGANAQGNAVPFLSTLLEIVDRIQQDYVDEPSITEAMRGAIRGMVERVDPHGGYLDAESVAFYNSFDPLDSPGIGVVLSKKFDYPVIVAATPGGPAALAGLGTGDTIEGIDGETLREHNLVEVYQLLSGAEGSTVELNAIRRTAAAAEVVTLTRTTVPVPPVETRMIEGNIGYLKVSLFGPGTAVEAATRVQELTGQGASGLILDLRNAAGGIRAEGFDLADIRIILGSHAHGDHQAADAFLREKIGAQIMIMEEDVESWQRMMRADREIPIDRILHDGDEVTLGGTTLVAHLTPGHTPGCTSWGMELEENGQTYNAFIVCSFGVNPGYNLIDNPNYRDQADDYRATFAKARAMPVDVFLGSHGSFYGLRGKYEALQRRDEGDPNPFVDRAGFLNYIDQYERRFQTMLETQQRDSR